MNPPINLKYSKLVETRILSLRKKDKLSKRNKEFVLEFVRYATTEGVGERRIVKYFGLLKNIDKWLGKDFDKATKEDIERIVGIVNTSNYQEWTKWSYRVIIKKFWKWLEGEDDEYPKKVKWIKARQGHPNITVPEDLITREDLKILIESSTSDRDRCIIALLYESGVRIEELLNLKIKDVDFQSDPVKIFVDARKTKTKRKIPIVESVPYITRWLNSHPDRKPESPLFVNCGKHRGKKLDRRSVYAFMRRLKEKLNNGKKMYPHLFRHSRATELANHLTEAQMNSFFGWRHGSRMPSVYVHLSGRDIDNAILNIYGKRKKEENIPERLKTEICPRCGQSNLSTDTFCLRCGLPLDEKTRLEFAERMSNMQPIMNKIEELIEAKVKEMLNKA